MNIKHRATILLGFAVLLSQESGRDDQRPRGAAFFHLAGLCQLGQIGSLEVLQLEAEIAERLRARS